MNTIMYRQATKDDIPLLVQNIVYASMKANSHCLHSWAGDSPEDLSTDFLAGLEHGELFYILASSGSGMIGAMGGEYDPHTQRLWLHGPHVFTGSWNLVAARLYDELLAILPSSIERWEAFLNVRNTNGIDFYRKHGYTQGPVAHDYHLVPARRRAHPSPDCQALTPELHDGFTRLFDQLFPDSYYSAANLLKLNGSSHHIEIVRDGEQVLGFVVAAVEGGGGKGEIQFLGVRQERRSAGYGRQLLAKGCDWLFDQKAVNDIALNVEESLTNARGLYESVGFILSFSGLPLTRKKVIPLEL